MIVLVPSATVKPAAVEPAVSAPVDVILPWTAEGSVAVNAGTAEPFVARTSLFPLAIAASVAPDVLCASSAFALPETIVVVPTVMLAAVAVIEQELPNTQGVALIVVVLLVSPRTPALSEMTKPVPLPPVIVVALPPLTMTELAAVVIVQEPPRVQVVPLATMEELVSWALPSVPVTPPFTFALPRLIGGMSEETRARKVGGDALPLLGPANTLFTLSFAKAPVSVPVVVTGLPLTVKIEGRESPTLETVPAVLATLSV